MTYFEKWYKDICHELQQNANFKKLEVEFNQQATDVGRISVLFKHNELGKKIDKFYTAKCNKKSEQHRTIGNKQYSRKEFDKAILSYSNSISYGIENSKELSLAYANRSAVLYAMKNYKLCQNDISLAFEKCYPTNLHYKLHERLGRCYLDTGDTDLASSTFKCGLASLEKSGLDIKKKNELAHNFSELIDKCTRTITRNDSVELVMENYMYIATPPALPNDDINEIYPCASKAFSIIETENEGRHAVATRDIPVGEIVIVEKPFTSICLSNCLNTHCYNCLIRFNISYPCRNCASVRFCSFDCETKCWDSFHCYECEYLGLLTHDDIGLGHLALKMIIQVGKDELTNFEINKDKIGGLGTNENGIYEPSDYRCVYSLVGNSDLRKPSDLFRRSLIALYLCHILYKTGFLKEDVTLNDDYCKIGSHLLKQLQMLPCNAHEVSELQLVGEDVAGAELKEIGSAAYTTLSLLNHSCDPSVVRHCYGDVCALRAIKYIKKGEPIIDNYGHLYPVEEKAARLKDLYDQYYFHCNCIPCMKDWPLYNDIVQEFPKFMCSNCDGILENGITRCLKCGHEDPDLDGFYNLQADYQICMENVLNTGEYSNDLPRLLQYLNIVSRKGKLPVIHFNNCQEVVKLCFGLQGNYVKLTC